LTGFADHFSGHAGEYAKYRPGYPPEVFGWIASQASQTGAVWDCGTGNGQAAVALADHFDLVYATDPSQRQLDQATMHPNVTYATASAEASGLDNQSVDAVVVAQAIHWFDHQRFYQEVRRVSRQGAIIVAVGYARPFFETEELNSAFLGLADMVESDWPAERAHVEARYETIDFPFERLAVPAMEMGFDWPLEGLLGYLSTWSASQRLLARTGIDAVAETRDAFSQAWGNPAETKRVSWPLLLMAGKVDES
jgi:SAM-dependent methyltransferase